VNLLERLFARFVAPQPLVRLELVRILVPLAVLGFLSSRIAHVDDWLSVAGFHIPDLGRANARQPFFVEPLSATGARVLAGLLVVSALGLAAGAWTRVSGVLFTIALLYADLIDRLSEFTVSKIGVVLALALTLSPAGARLSVDALRRRKKLGTPPPTLVAAGYVRAFQLLLPTRRPSPSPSAAPCPRRRGSPSSSPRSSTRPARPYGSVCPGPGRSRSPTASACTSPSGSCSGRSSGSRCS
jgi:hypothetical protein